MSADVTSQYFKVRGLIKPYNYYTGHFPCCIPIFLPCSLAEVEEYQLAIASNEKVIQQTLSLAVTPSFKFGPSLVAISTLDNLSGK